MQNLSKRIERLEAATPKSPSVVVWGWGKTPDAIDCEMAAIEAKGRSGVVVTWQDATNS
jgi:hypothetical protein